MRLPRKALVWFHGKVKTPPFSEKAREEAGGLLRKLQRGFLLSLPHSRPMPVIGARCSELRINDRDVTWRIMVRADDDAIIIVEVFAKKTEETPDNVIDNCKARLAAYDEQKAKKQAKEATKGAKS